MPDRIQLRRTKGWRKPAGAVIVARPSIWGNPWGAGNPGRLDALDTRYQTVIPITQSSAVNLYRDWLNLSRISVPSLPDLSRLTEAGAAVCFAPSRLLGRAFAAALILARLSSDMVFPFIGGMKVSRRFSHAFFTISLRDNFAMSDNTKIEWADKTFNPWIGCQKVGPGCDHCYAEAWDARGLQQREGRWGAHATRTRTSAGNWSKPKAWNKAAAGLAERPRVFCASLADVFDNHASILPEWRADLWELIRATPNLDWMLLTKRPGNIGNMLPVPFDFARLYPNVWLGCTITSREEMLRDGPKLASLDARVRFWSVEPLLGDFGEVPSDLMPDLVIVGGESGPGARPMHPDWPRALRDQCVAAGVKFFFKQWGEWGQAAARPSGTDGKYAIASAAPHSDFWPQRVVETDHYPRQINLFGGARVLERVGKARAGRLLDGRTWDQMPGVPNG